MLGQLKELGVSPERVVPIAFHVDYFNDPWKDTLSDPRHSRREYQYSLIYRRDHEIEDPNYLYFTPMLMVDGRSPMLGSDRAKAREAIRQALAEPPGVALGLALEDGDDARHKTLKVALSRPSAEVAGREVLVGVATYEEPVTTRVKSGENAGKALVEHFAARGLTVEVARPKASGTTRLAFPVALGKGWDASKCGLAVFVQDEETGHIHQAGSIRWEGESSPTDPGKKATARGKAKRR